MSDREAAIREQAEADLLALPLRKRLRLYINPMNAERWIDLRELELLQAELAAARERIEQLEEGAWPWEWVIATRERERWKAAEERERVLQEALESDPEKWSFDGLVRIAQALLDASYPPDIFTGESGDPGPLFVARLRQALAALDDGEGDPPTDPLLVPRVDGEGET